MDVVVFCDMDLFLEDGFYILIKENLLRNYYVLGIVLSVFRVVIIVIKYKYVFMQFIGWEKIEISRNYFLCVNWSGYG